MQFVFTPSHQALRPFVNGYYYIELDAGPDARPLDIHPVGYHTMAFTLNSRQVFRSTASEYDFNLSYHGLICEHISLFPMAPKINMVVVSFTSTGASRLFGVSQHQLINQIHPIEDIVPEAMDLKLRLEDGISCGMRAIDLIEHWLLRRISAKSPFRYGPNIDRACSLIQRHRGIIPIGELSREVGMSQRYLESHFKDMIGTTPKMYCRIVRFLAAYQFILGNDDVDWGELIYRHQFFDQSHFIHDFKRFFGRSPSKIHLANSHLAGKIALEL